MAIGVIFSLAAGLFIGVYKTSGFLFLFKNTNDKLDMSIFWTAAGAISTAALGLIAFIQNQNANKMNKRLTEESLVGSSYSLLEPQNIEIRRLNDKDILHKSLAVFTNLAKINISNGDWLEVIFKLNSLTVIKPTYYTFEKISFSIDDNLTYYIGCHKNQKVKFGQKDNKLVCKFYIQLDPVESKNILYQIFKKSSLSILLEMTYINPFNIMAKGKFDITFNKITTKEDIHPETEAKYNVYLSNFLDSSFELHNL